MCGVSVKVYFLRLTSANFSLEDGRWVSPVVDLYQNDSYTNYSITKSKYGTVNAPLRTWLGLRRSESVDDWENLRFFTRDEIVDETWRGEDFNTDSGIVRDDRFIDTSGRIDIVNYKVNVATSLISLTIFTDDNSDDSDFLHEWERNDSHKSSEAVEYVGAHRYAKFIIDTDSENLPDDLSVYIRIEINVPVIAPMYQQTYRLLNKFPEWMELNEKNLATVAEEVEQPDTIGGSFLNAIAGEWLDDLTREISYRDFQRYISRVDLNQMAWAYSVSISEAFVDDMLPPMVLSVVGNGVTLAQAVNWNEFIKSTEEDVYYVDYETRTVYTTKAYSDFKINDREFTQEPFHVRNYIDEIGTFVDLDRLYLEGNDNYSWRIRDVYRNRGGVGVDSLKKALRRELDIWKAVGSRAGAIQDAERAYDEAVEEYGNASTEAQAAEEDIENAKILAEQAHPEILDMEAIEADPKYFNDDGMPTKTFVELVEDLSWKYPSTWGRFNWHEAWWDSGGREEDGHPGYGIIPNRYDQELVEDRYLQSGVGDGNDLFVFRPDVITGARDVTTTLKVKGRHRVPRTEYPGVDVEFSLRGKGTRLYYEHPPKTIWLTAEVTLNDDEESMYLASFLMTAQSDVDAGQPEPSEESYTVAELFADSDDNTSPDLNFVRPDTNAQFNDTGIIPTEDIKEISIVQGRWVAGQYQNLETANHYEVWLSDDDEEVLTQPGGGSLSITRSAEGDLPHSLLIMKSLLVSDPTPGPWQSDEYRYNITVNGINPYTSPGSPPVVDVPEILWDPYAYDREIEIALQITDEEGNFGAVTKDNEDEEVFIPTNLIRINNDATWTDGVKSIPPAVDTFDLSIDTSSDIYPIVFDTWEIFEYSQIEPYPGVVDENGPWLNGFPQKPGSNRNYTLVKYDNLDRDDFGVPNNSDYVVTWIGIEDDNDRVLTWINTNVIIPIDDTDRIDYPSDAINENLLNGSYYFDPVTVYARLRGIDPEWKPQVHSGYLYDRADEYYFYANKKVETASSSEHILAEVARQGAPIIATTTGANPVELRQVSFFEEVDGRPELTLTNKQVIQGTGTENLYLAYHDIYDIEIRTSDDELVTSVPESETNKITLDEPTDRDQDYVVTYKINNSFYANHSYVDPTTGLQRTKVVFDAVGEYQITYEASDYDPARIVDVNLNPLYTTQNEGFLYVSFNEYTLESIQIRLNPGKMLADGVDYTVLTIRSLDKHGNPKPNQEFNISTTFGTFDETEITTDTDGFVAVTLRSSDNYVDDFGTISITGEVNASIEFEIEEPQLPTANIFAVPSTEQIVADGESKVLVYGKIEDTNFEPVSGVSVTWKKARSLYEMFSTTEPNIVDSGTEPTDSDGIFVIGPFTVTEPEESGYWFVAVEAEVGGDLIGDVVFWYEFPDANLGVENIDGLPRQAVQFETPLGTYPEMIDEYAHPVKYDETKTAPEELVTVNWEPPSWYAIDGYLQYQMNLQEHRIDKHI